MPAAKGSARTALGPIFKDFKVDINGSLDFTEFLVAEQLRWVFRLVDRDRSGSIKVKGLVEHFSFPFLYLAKQRFIIFQ